MITIYGKPMCSSCTKAKAWCESHNMKFEYKQPVSYTHLTLPTTPYV